MRNYCEWLETKGYYVREAWSEKKGQMSGEGLLVLMPHQKRILSHTLTFDENERLPYETVLYSATKKSGKTAIAASVGAWYAEESRAGTEIYVIANSQEQGAGRVFRDIVYHFEKRMERYGPTYCRVSQFRIEFPNGTFIQVLAQSFRSIAGSRHALTLWDELWGATTELDRRVWDEMTPIPTVTNSLRFISTYAGFENESELLWELYLRGVGKDENDKGRGEKIAGMEDLPVWKSGKMFTYWTHDPTMPWQTQEYLDEQLESERPAAYLRLHQNQWVTSQEVFIPVEWWERAEKFYEANALVWEQHPFRRWPIVLGVDAGVKHDSTALVGVGYDSARAKVGLVYHKIWTPLPGDPVDLDVTVAAEILSLYNKFRVVSVVCDPSQFLAIIMKLKKLGIPIREFDQTSGNMIPASQMLYDLLKNKNIEAYPADDLKRHIQMAVAETSSRGFRIMKTKTARRHHIDGAIALAMAAYEAVVTGGVDTTVPIVLSSPYSDATAWKSSETTQSDLPPELRDDED